MTRLLLSAPNASGMKGRILVIEADSSRASRLRDILRGYDGIELDIVGSVAFALKSLSRRVPDVLLTSSFLTPADAAALTRHLKDLPDAEHVQIITVPYFIDADGDESAEGRVLNFLRRRSDVARPRCDSRTLREQIEQYLTQAKTLKRELGNRAAGDARLERDLIVASRPRDDVRPMTAALVPAGSCARSRHNGIVPPSDRRRARRRTAGDLPWLWTVRLTGASQVALVDISSAGVLLETTSRLVDGTTVDLELVGQDTNVLVPARMVRSQVASVNGLGVRYRVAIAFARELDLIGLQTPAGSVATPSALGEVLTRVLTDVTRNSTRTALHARFEQEVRRLLPVRDVQIRQTPAVAEWGSDSIYFTIPYGSGSQPILQAIFEPGYAPTAAEFHLLKAAAKLAAVVMEFAA
jgi:hypothetical protein